MSEKRMDGAAAGRAGETLAVGGVEKSATIRYRVNIGGNPKKGKCYAKQVTSVDLTKTNGYALEGNFLKEREYDFKEGDILLFVEEEGSWKHHSSIGTVMRVEGGEMQKKKVFDYFEEFLTLRDYIATLLGEKSNPFMGFTDRELIDELIRRGYADAQAIVK